MANAESTLEGVTQQVAHVQIQAQEEEDGLEIPEQQIAALQGNLQLSLVGRFLTERFIRKVEMSHIMASNWRPGRGIFVEEIRPQLFLFQFGHEADVARILDGGPWAYDNHALLLERVPEGVDPGLIEQNHLTLWMQVCDLPAGFMSEHIASRIAEKVGSMVESDPNNYTSVWHKVMRIRVNVDVRKPLKKGTRIRHAGGEWRWVSFRYERLPTFCFLCGVIGHGEKFCPKLYELTSGQLERAYGPELRMPIRRSSQLTIGERWLRSTPIEKEEFFGGKTNEAGRHDRSGEKHTSFGFDGEGQSAAGNPTNPGILNHSTGTVHNSQYSFLVAAATITVDSMHGTVEREEVMIDYVDPKRKRPFEERPLSTIEVTNFSSDDVRSDLIPMYQAGSAEQTRPFQ